MFLYVIDFKMDVKFRDLVNFEFEEKKFLCKCMLGVFF